MLRVRIHSSYFLARLSIFGVMLCNYPPLCMILSAFQELKNKMHISHLDPILLRLTRIIILFSQFQAVKSSIQADYWIHPNV